MKTNLNVMKNKIMIPHYLDTGVLENLFEQEKTGESVTIVMNLFLHFNFSYTVYTMKYITA